MDLECLGLGRDLRSAPLLRTLPGVKHAWIARWIAVLLASAAASQASEPSLTTDFFDDMDAASVGGAPTNHAALFQHMPETGPLIWPPPPPVDPARQALARLEEVTNEFSAPPLIVTRISQLPAASGLSPEQIVERFERNMLRERVLLADRLFRGNHYNDAIALLLDLDKYLRDKRNRIIMLNRLAAYHFRLQHYDVSAAMMRKAYDLQPGDPASACNLAAVLVTRNKLDEALGLLLEVYPSMLDKPVFAFSIHFNLACVYSLKGEVEKSIQNLAIAAQVDPASTFASLGDPNLDRIRNHKHTREIAATLERFLSQNTRHPPARR